VCLAILKGHTDVVRGVQFDDSKIISCSMDKTIRIWSLGTFECVRVIQGHTSGVVSIHFIDRFLASGSVDGIVRVWNLQAGTSFTLVGHARCVNKVQILACKTQLLSCSDDGKTVNILVLFIYTFSRLSRFCGIFTKRHRSEILWDTKDLFSLLLF
jgi:F-box/WD-40 domain protein MET30